MRNFKQTFSDKTFKKLATGEKSPTIVLPMHMGYVINMA